MTSPKVIFEEVNDFRKFLEQEFPNYDEELVVEESDITNFLIKDKYVSEYLKYDKFEQDTSYSSSGITLMIYIDHGAYSITGNLLLLENNFDDTGKMLETVFNKDLNEEKFSSLKENTISNILYYIENFNRENFLKIDINSLPVFLKNRMMLN